MRAYILILSVCSALVVSGCESTNFTKYNPFRHYSDERGHSGLYLRADKEKIAPPFSSSKSSIALATPISTGSLNQGTGDSSVEIFDLDDNAYLSNPFVVGQGMQSFGGHIISSNSSVTIFSLDGPAPMFNSGFGGGMTNAMGYHSGASNNQIFFTHGSSHLGGGDLRGLSSVAEQAKFAPVNYITVAGYASKPTQAGRQTIEGNILNLKESMNRAYAVSKTLIKKGVPAEKIKTVSWGAAKTSGQDSQDRRVDIIMGEQ